MYISNCLFINCVITIVCASPVSVERCTFMQESPLTIVNGDNSMYAKPKLPKPNYPVEIPRCPKSLTLEDVMRAKKMLLNNDLDQDYFPSYGTYTKSLVIEGCNSITSLTPECTPKNKDKQPMYINTNMTKDQTAQIYLRGRLDTTVEDKTFELNQVFGLSDDDAPTTFADAYKRILDGMFVVPEDKKEKEVYSPLNMIRWRNPATKEDQKGFEAAIDRMELASTKVKDAIMVKTPQEALTALEEFESSTFH